MSARKQHNNTYQAWTYALAGLLALTNAAWFLSSRIKANDHAAALQAARTTTTPPERVVYEYRDRTPTPEPQVRPSIQRQLEPFERCQAAAGNSREGVVISKRDNEWSSTGEQCDPTLV